MDKRDCLQAKKQVDAGKEKQVRDMQFQGRIIQSRIASFGRNQARLQDYLR